MHIDDGAAAADDDDDDEGFSGNARASSANSAIGSTFNTHDGFFGFCYLHPAQRMPVHSPRRPAGVSGGSAELLKLVSISVAAQQAACARNPFRRRVRADWPVGALGAAGATDANRRDSISTVFISVVWTRFDFDG